MAQSTKQALAATLKQLLEKKSLDDITVKEIVEACEVNRQTFYYHFQDIYDLLGWFLEQEARQALAGVGRAKLGLAAGITPDAVLLDLEEAMAALGELTGSSVREDVTARIFQRFCVGK